MYDKLRALSTRFGFNKKWIYKSNTNRSLAYDFLQKISYSIQDINEELNNDLKMKEIVFIIALIDWIKDSYIRIKALIRTDVFNGFNYKKANNLKKAKEYFEAIRSYIVAHPMNTTRHSKFGFDGNFICVDIRTNNNIVIPFVKEDKFYFIDYDGIHNGKNKKHTFYLYSYSKNTDGAKYGIYISFSVNDLINVARLYIDAVNKFNAYLAKVKKKNYNN